MTRIRQYNPSIIESKWSKTWEEKKIYQVDIKKAQKPFYNLAMFPYPSGEGLHIGHIVPYSGVDTYGRYKMMRGFDVFEPMGFDSFGIHSENFAIKKGLHPKELTSKTISYFRDKQMKRLGTLFDWSRMVATSDPDYYKWTQWLFVQMFKHGLAEKKMSLVTYCPSCKTVLSDEQTETKDGVIVCERCKTPIERKEMKQWFFKITKYAERLLNNLPKIDWSERTKLAQKNWIGRSEGVLIKFKVQPIRQAQGESSKFKVDEVIEVFTTAHDTIFGVTFMVLSPEHEFVRRLLDSHSESHQGGTKNPAKCNSLGNADARSFSASWRIRMTEERFSEVEEYVIKASTKTEQERITAGKNKTGVFTGIYAVNPLNGEEVPIWIADYVLMGYGTGAVMGVPGHDARDHEFAIKYGLPIKPVIRPLPQFEKQAHVEADGFWDYEEIKLKFAEKSVVFDSGFLDGSTSKEAKLELERYIEEKRIGKKEVNYKLRDWCISRQRYWGPPIPMVHCSSCEEKGITYFDLISHSESASWRTRNPSTLLGTGLAKRNTDNDADARSFASLRMTINRDDFTDMEGWFPVPENELPVLLPETKDYLPDGSGKSPLARIAEFAHAKCPYCGGLGDRETDVSDTFLDSSWYFLRYPSVGIVDDDGSCQELVPSDVLARKSSLRALDGTPSAPATRNFVSHALPWDPEITKKWLPVDIYIGGQEHACLHLMYARFVTMALYDMGYIHFEEPFTKFFAHGLMIKEGAKMSKSRGNVVDPVKYLDLYGSDCLRMYVLFMGPYDQKMDFRDSGIDGMYRFLGRVYSFVHQVKDAKNQTEDKTLVQLLHKMTKVIGEDIEKLHFNTSIAHLMEILNAFSDYKEGVTIIMVKHYLTLLAPFAPFISEELWSQTNKTRSDSNWSVHQQSWPEYNEKLLEEEEVTMVVQVNGKVRDQFTIYPPSLRFGGAGNLQFTKENEENITKQAMAREKIKKYLSGRKIVRTVFVPGKLINFVV